MKIILNKITKESYICKMVQTLPALRAKLNMTQAELAERMGVTRQTLTALENGSRPMSWSNFLALCFIFESNSETQAMLDVYDICPEILRNYLGFI